ncbi:MAG TPA: hypothetical protein VNL16_09420 [Chloroflexota bacterium]|nr:hypothetical protein [Chloroflexota bacterium]
MSPIVTFCCEQLPDLLESLLGIRPLQRLLLSLVSGPAPIPLFGRDPWVHPASPEKLGEIGRGLLNRRPTGASRSYRRDGGLGRIQQGELSRERGRLSHHSLIRVGIPGLVLAIVLIAQE